MCQMFWDSIMKTKMKIIKQKYMKNKMILQNTFLYNARIQMNSGADYKYELLDFHKNKHFALSFSLYFLQSSI